MDIKKEVEGSLYIMASTLNQMVNYIPYKYFQFKKIWNITTNDPRNKEWDKYFKNAVNNSSLNISSIEFEKTIILNIKEVKKRLTNELKKYTPPNKFFWNITGGQRPVLMAVYDLVRELSNYTHYLCYLEGNSGEMRIMKFEKGALCDVITNSYVYNIDGLKIDIALKLMGYNANAHPKDVLDDANYIKSLNDFYDKFFPAYEKHKTIRTTMTELNGENSGEITFNRIIDNFPVIASLSTTEMKVKWDHYKKRKSFGYILEEMLVYWLLKIIYKNTNLKNKIAGVYPSVKIAADYYKDNTSIDEFDTLILTKTGQLLCFECKSGGMEKEAAKSTKYSTYAIGGVYGNSVLVSPQIDKNDKISDSITKAIGYANRANLKIWYLNESELEKELNNIK